MPRAVCSDPAPSCGVFAKRQPASSYRACRYHCANPYSSKRFNKRAEGHWNCAPMCFLLGGLCILIDIVFRFSHSRDTFIHGASPRYKAIVTI